VAVQVDGAHGVRPEDGHRPSRRHRGGCGAGQDGRRRRRRRGRPLRRHRLETARREQIILLGSNPERIALGQEFGATDIVRERGAEAVERVRELTGALGAHSVLECVGLEQAVDTALEIARPGGAVGRVGIPEHDSTPTGVAFWKNATIGGGPAPVRAYVEELLPDVLEGRIEPGRVFDRTGALDEVSDGYRAMNERRVLKFEIAF
jgi:threonine dehydrogenase-like Zn-dependent dehydrogenase